MQKLSIYIPENHEKSEGIIRQILTDLSHLAGGATRQNAQGSWLNAYQYCVIEPIAQVYTLAKEHVASKVQTYLQAQARQVKQDLGQECVLVTVENVAAALFVS